MDYRKGIPPTKRKVESEEAIRKALTEGKRTFGNLLKETGLSRSALAFHLKEMYKKGQLERETDPKDYRVTFYSLTSNGRDEFHRQKDIETLSSAESLISPEIITGLADAVSKFLKPSIREYLLRLEEEEFKILKESITFSIYFSKPMSDSAAKNYDYVRRLAQLAVSSMLSELVTNLQHFERIPELTLVFRLNKDRFKEYLRLRKQKDRAEKEPIPKLPDMKDFKKLKED